MGSETYVGKVALHEGFEPPTTEFRSPCSAVELMEQPERDETYVGSGLMPLLLTFDSNVFFIMGITITQFGKMSTAFAKYFCLPSERVEDKGLSLLFPPRSVHLFLGNEVDVFVQSHEHHGNALLT